MPARILVVEDNPANLKLMSYLLRAFGYTVLTASDGEEALEVLGREQADLVVCDVQLPKLDGIGVVRRIKQDERLRGIPVVAVTALAMVGDREKVLSAGFDDYLSKPIVPQTFVSQVEAFLPAEQRGQSRSTAPAATAPPAAPADTKATVLAVDNTQANLEVIRKTLEPFGYRLLGARGVKEALALLARSAPDLILSDLHMPEADGFDFIRAVKSDPRLSAIPFVFLSSSVWQDRDQVEGIRLGAARFLRRPISPQKLLAEVQATLTPPKEG